MVGVASTWQGSFSDLLTPKVSAANEAKAPAPAGPNAMLSPSASTLISPTGDGGFETGASMAANGWTTVNNATNGWFAGTAVASAGTRSAYISNTSGTTYAYSNTTAAVSHFYRDVTVPAGETHIKLSFKLRGDGDISSGTLFDKMMVYTAPTTFTPTTAAPASSGVLLAGTTSVFVQTTNNSAAHVQYFATLPASLAGTTFRLIFTWHDDTSTGTVPSSVDEISLTSTAPSLVGAKNIPGDYPTVTAAINDLNTNGVGAGGVTFNLTDGASYAEELPCITAEGTAANQITFKNSGSATHAIISPTGTANTAPGDAGVCIKGGDYITFDGVDVTIATGSAVEYGYRVINEHPTNGAQHNTIKNTSITLNRANTLSQAILQSADVLGGGTTPSGNSTADLLAGGNSFNHYYNLAVQNAYSGVYLRTLVAVSDTDNEVGVTGGGTTTIGGAAASDIGAGTVATWGIRGTAENNLKIFGTEVKNVGVTGAVTVDGIFLDQTFGTSDAFSNKVHDIRSTSTSSTSVIAGIRSNTLNSPGPINRVYNNFIWNLTSGYTGAATATRQIKGISVQSGGTGVGTFHHIDFNSVRIDGSASPNVSSTALAIGSTSGPIINVRNNILANVTGAQAGVAKHIAWESTSATLTGISGSVSNNNDLYIANTTQGFVGLGNTTNFATLANWQAAMTGQDTNSKSSNPQFLSATDLHINPAIATEVESTGSYFAGAITWASLDIDGNTRSVSTPDIGADEGTFIALDLSAPSISYSTLANTSSLLNRSLPNVTVTDFSGVNTTPGTRPRVYYKKTTEANAFVGNTSADNGWKFVETSDASSPFSFIINYALLTAPVTSGDQIQYFVVAQDNASPANVAINSGSFAAAPASVSLGAAQAPIGGSINSYTIVPSISGGKNVGIGGDFATITAAVAAINGAEITGPVTLNLTDATYPTETFPLTLNANNGSNSTNTVTMQPAPGVSPSISGSASTCLINLNGADWVTINGSNGGGTPAGTSRDMTLTNTNTGISSVVVCMTSTGTGAGATNDTVKNTNIVGSGNAQTLFGVYSGGSAISITGAGADNDNDRVENNNISATQYGVYSGGISTGNKNGGTVITKNLMNAVSPNNIAKGGVLARFEDGIQITENSIGNMAFSTSFSTSSFGIALGVIPNNTFTAHTGSDVTNAQLIRNSIVNVAQTATGSAYGVIINSVTSGTTLVKNNMVSGVTSNTTPSDITCGILAGGGTGSITQIYNNSVYLLGDRGAGTTSGSFAFVYGGGDPVMDIKNNVFANTQITASTGLSYAIGTNSSTFVNLTSTNNDLFTTTGATFAVGRTGGIDQGAGSPTGVDKVTLAAWNATTGQDSTLLSKSVDPLFISGSDLHLQESPSQSPVVLSGVSIGSVTNDFDNDPRPTASNPDMGADEVVQTDGGTFPAGTFYNARPTVGSTFAGNFTVTGTLYPAGIVDIGANTVTLGCNAATGGVDLNNYIVGNVQKDFCSTGSFNYPVGTVPNGSARGDGDQSPEGSPSEYTPVLVTVNSGSFPASLAISVTDTYLPGLGATSSLSRNWTVTQTGGALNVDMQFQYLNEDVYGVETSYKPFKYNGVTTVQQPGSINAAGNQFTATGVTSFSKWGAGVAAPTAANADISGRVTTAGGMPIANVKVTLTGGGLDHTVVGYTSSLGYYNFEGLPVGQNYVVTVKSRRFFFSEPSHFITLQDNITDGDFVADPQQ